MLFNSFSFFAFFALFYALYWLSNSRLRLRNGILLAGSYFFYGCWDWRFLSLIWISTLVDFFCGRRIHASRDPGQRKRFLALSVLANLGLLGVFKYFDFFAASAADLAALLGFRLDHPTLHLILPVGISFYTFQTLTYTIDIYRRELEPTDSLLDFASFVAFFPQLVAGPIERAAALLPQIARRAMFDFTQARGGLFLVLWGLFKKVMIADRISPYIDTVYAGPEAFTSLQVLLATLLFAAQIYCDFSGYSDIARGVAKLLGIELMVNFDTPYLATSLRDFWRRWHISLSTWFRDYVYIPLGGSRRGPGRTRLNLLATFVISGFWHGAAYNFLIWGFLHGAMQVVDPFSHRRRASNPIVERLLQGLGLVVIFAFVNLAWVFFRARTLDDAGTVLRSIAGVPAQLAGRAVALRDLIVGMNTTEFVVAGYAIAILVAVDLLVRNRQIDRFAAGLPQPARWLFAWFLLANFLIFGASNAGPFIYFQF